VWLFVVIPAPYFRKYASNPRLNAFVLGVTASATGAIAGAAVVIARGAVHDVPTALLAVGAFAAVLKLRVPEPLVVAAAGIVGLLAYPG
jgi:chromate transporter